MAAKSDRVGWTALWLAIAIVPLSFLAMLWVAAKLDSGGQYLEALTTTATVASAIFTLIAAVGAGAYVWQNTQLWEVANRQAEEAAKQRETELMLRLMDEYDGLRQHVITLQKFFMESISSSVSPKARFADEAFLLIEGGGDPWIQSVDDSRFALSRFFVRIRKLVRAGLLTEHVVTASLDRAVFERVFLGLVEPLDEAKVGRPSYDPQDRQFFTELLDRYAPARTEGLDA